MVSLQDPQVNYSESKTEKGCRSLGSARYFWENYILFLIHNINSGQNDFAQK